MADGWLMAIDLALGIPSLSGWVMVMVVIGVIGRCISQQLEHGVVENLTVPVHCSVAGAGWVQLKVGGIAPQGSQKTPPTQSFFLGVGKGKEKKRDVGILPKHFSQY